MATIKDIAKAADVSIATVSMVLNGKDCITKKTKDKVMKAARELNYIPSLAAKTLKTNRSHTIALFAGDISNPFFPEIIKGVEAAAKMHDYSVIIYDLSGDNVNFINLIDRAVSQRVDGIFITGGDVVSEEVKEKLLSLKAAGIQVVTCNMFMDWGVFPIIKTDDRDAVDTLLSKLAAYGHKHIGCISGKKSSWVTERREMHFKQALEQYGLYHPEYVINEGFSIEDGKEAAKKLLTKYPEITAVMCINDTLAIGCHAGAKELGRRVPDELSIFGVDGIECLKYFSPEITTVDTHRYEYGFGGTERLIDLIADESGERTELLEDMTFVCSVRKGDTVKPPLR